jgi:hypothetical protein
MMTGDWKEAKVLLDEAAQLSPEEPLIVSLLGVYWALAGKGQRRVIRRETPQREYATAMYSKQLIATDDTVIMRPAGVERQPLVSIMNEGQSKCLRLVWPITSTPETPYHSNASTVQHTASPIAPPIDRTNLVVIRLLSHYIIRKCHSAS